MELLFLTMFAVYMIFFLYTIKRIFISRSLARYCSKIENESHCGRLGPVKDNLTHYTKETPYNEN